MSNIATDGAPTSTTDGAAVVDSPITADSPAVPQDAPSSGDPTPAPAPAPAADAPAHWAAALGDELAGKLKDYASVDDLVAAATRGKDYVPAKTLEEFDFGPKPTNEFDLKLQESYKRYCLECGVTPQMAKDLAEWNLKTHHELRQAQFEAGQANLRAKWGVNYDEKVNGALSMVVTLDKVMDGRLSKELASSGGNNNPVIVETLYTLSTLISEDTLSGANGGGSTMKPMSTEEFIASEVFSKG